MNAVFASICIGLMALVSVQPVEEEELDCSVLCARALDFVHLDACNGWVASLTWDVGAQDGLCECDGGRRS